LYRDYSPPSLSVTSKFHTLSLHDALPILILPLTRQNVPYEFHILKNRLLLNAETMRIGPSHLLLYILFPFPLSYALEISQFLELSPPLLYQMDRPIPVPSSEILHRFQECFLPHYSISLDRKST